MVILKAHSSDCESQLRAIRRDLLSAFLSSSVGLQPFYI